MKRILVYGMTENSGGIEAYLMNYFRRFDKDEIVFDFVTDFSNIAYEDEIKALGGRIYHIPARRESLLKHMLGIRKIVSENGYDTVYYNILSASAVFSLLGLFGKRNVKIITHSHNNSVGNMKVHLALRPILNMMTDVRLACSREAAEFMFGEKYSDSTKVINNAIELENYKYSEEIRAEVRKEFGIEDKFVVGHVGRLCYQKNTLFLLDIFNEILKKDENSVLLLVGNGEDREAVEAKIKALGMEESVIMTGVRPDVARLMQSMDVFLFPSRFEGLGIVLIEAQAAGLKAFTSKDVVPLTAKATDLLEYISLEKSPEEWAEAVLSFKSYERKDVSDIIKGTDYDIKNQVEVLQSYLKGFGKEKCQK